MSAPPSVQPVSAHDRRQRRMLVALALFFFAPLAVSFLLYYGSGGWRPAKQVNRGTLIDPARPLPELRLPLAGGAAAAQPPALSKPDVLKAKWTLLYVGAGSCTERCRHDLYNMRQVRLLLNRNMDRVQRVFLAQGACCDFPFLEHEHPDLVTLLATPAAAPLLDRLPSVGGIAPAEAERIYIVDPLGNLMMSYAPDADPKGLLEDLKRLLGLSQVG
jgi:cytochrome oxidase Cu insertion factor (SCO1/SenC/PrrC family)